MFDVRVNFPKPCDEPWDGMTPHGCGRMCASCDRVVHDLRNYTVDEVEALARIDPHLCVRAAVGADGAVALKRGPNGRIRRMIVAMGASAGLLMTGIPASAKDQLPTGAISGRLTYTMFKITVVATGADGTVHGGKVRSNGRYLIEHLPAGEYALTFTPGCGEPWTLESKVVVKEAETIVPDGPAEGECIVIGLLQIENNEG